MFGFAIISLRKREREGCYYFLMYFDCLFTVSLPQGAVGWSTVFDCGFSWSYSLTFYCDLVQIISKNTVSTIHRALL